MHGLSGAVAEAGGLSSDRSNAVVTRVTATLVPKGGSWVMVAEQMTIIPEQ